MARHSFEWWEPFISSLKTTGRIDRSAKAVKISTSTVTTIFKARPDMKRQADEAIREYKEVCVASLEQSLGAGNSLATACLRAQVTISRAYQLSTEFPGLSAAISAAEERRRQEIRRSKTLERVEAYDGADKIHFFEFFKLREDVHVRASIHQPDCARSPNPEKRELAADRVRLTVIDPAKVGNYLLALPGHITVSKSCSLCGGLHKRMGAPAEDESPARAAQIARDLAVWYRVGYEEADGARRSNTLRTAQSARAFAVSRGADRYTRTESFLVSDPLPPDHALAAGGGDLPIDVREALAQTQRSMELLAAEDLRKALKAVTGWVHKLWMASRDDAAGCGDLSQRAMEDMTLVIATAARLEAVRNMRTVIEKRHEEETGE